MTADILDKTLGKLRGQPQALVDNFDERIAKLRVDDIEERLAKLKKQ